ncbi:MAG TPA: tRNA 2-thiouridine(34) synthase MnmA [Candidatus Paceibacterota bacterium]|nr:tRNA 2-thiouridine(34) synthase MnmA [Candidatus Paceibacterota bacterium]
MKVFVGLSGGVDSAVSAALLQQQEHDVVGVFIRIALPGYPCSAGEDKISAQRVAAHLQIPFIEIDLSKEYADNVFAYTIAELAKGRTPNPDTLCNQKIKFGAFYEYARSHGADAVATGHYARTKNGLLYKGVDTDKDQSYFLWMVPHEVLKHTMFPIGEMRKTDVRALAAKFDLPNAARPDSQGLCFLSDTSIDEMIRRELEPLPGNVLDEAGTVVGRHDGAALYTMGQRHGFELFAHTPQTQPHFVIAKNNEANTITVSTERFPIKYKNTEVELAETNWIGVSEKGPCLARFRYRQTLIPAVLQELNSRGSLAPAVTLQEPHYVPYGQSLVLYQGQQCIGGGIVEKTRLC